MISARALVPMSKLQDAGDGQDAAVDFASPPANKRLRRSPEPTSVLYKRSPSPATSSAPPMSMSAEDWEALLPGDISIAAATTTTRGSQSHSHQGEEDSCFRAWIMDADADAHAAAFEFDPFLPPPASAAAEQAILLEPMTTLLPSVAYYDDLELEPQAAASAAAVDELLEAARHADAGDSTGAREILSRLNHHCNLPSPPTSPLLRAAALLRDAALPPPSSPVEVEVALKLLAAHKALADASPTVFQFASFTSTQALLDALGGARRLHVVDMGDVGFGARWPPLMQELAFQWRRASAAVTPPSMKVTALVSPPGPRSSAAPPHPLNLDLELHLTRQSLTRFAADLGIRFEFDAVVFDPLDPSPPVGVSAAPGEAVAVHLPVTSSLPAAALRVVKQLRPAIVVCVDDMPLTTTSHHAMNVVRWSAAFIESLHAAGAPPDAVANVEQHILRPRVVEMMKMTLSRNSMIIPWQTMFAAAGLAPVQLSDAAEAQAECLVSRTHTTSSPGFHVDKRQGALALRWRQTELVTVSAWRCC